MGQQPAGGTHRDGSAWGVSAAVVVAVAVGFATDARTGAFALAALLAACAVLRAALPGPAPVALGLRSRWVDVAVTTGLAAVLAVLAAIVPMPA